MSEELNNSVVLEQEVELQEVDSEEEVEMAPSPPEEEEEAPKKSPAQQVAEAEIGEYSGEEEDADDIDTERLDPEMLKQVLEGVMAQPPEQRAAYLQQMAMGGDINPNNKEFSSVPRKEVVRRRLRAKLEQKQMERFVAAQKRDEATLSAAEKALLEADSDQDSDEVSAKTRRNRKKRARRKAAQRRKKEEAASQAEEAPKV